MTIDELDYRTPIWLALSNLYLDKELDKLDLEGLAVLIRDSNLSLNEIKSIDFYEVAPLLGVNLWSPAGVWSGFDSDWVIENCTRNFKQRGKFIYRLKCHFQNLRWREFRKENWKRLELSIKKASVTE